MKASALFFHSDLLNRSQKQIYRTIKFPMFYFLETLATVQNKLSVSLLCRYNLGNNFSEFCFFILNLTNTQKFSVILMSIISSYDKQTHNSVFSSKKHILQSSKYQAAYFLFPCKRSCFKTYVIRYLPFLSYLSFIDYFIFCQIPFKSIPIIG